MIKTTDNLSGEALLLWEAAAVFDLGVEELAPCVGVTVDRIYEWFGGGQIPSEDEKSKILEGVEKMDREFPELESGEAVWGKPDEDAPEIIGDAEFRASVRPVFYELQGVCSDAEKRLVADNWPGFVEILGLLEKYDIGVPRRKARS